MLFDCHIHTSASPDGKMSPEEVALAAGKLGLGCIFTEHMDYNPDGEPVFCIDFDTYPGDYIKHKSENVCVGIEIGLVADGKSAARSIEINRSHASNKDYDYVLGSVHMTAGVDIYLEQQSFFGRGIEVYELHLSYILEMIKANDFFDALGHIDYISRYSPFTEKNVLYNEYTALYDEILTALIERGKVLELSTRRLDDKDACKNMAAIYSRYRELGGQYVTLGSDAHEANQIGRNFDIALNLIEEIGLHPVYFKERKIVLC